MFDWHALHLIMVYTYLDLCVLYGIVRFVSDDSFNRKTTHILLNKNIFKM